MNRVVFSLLARQDLDEIWSYIAQDNEAAASRLIQRLLTKCQSLTYSPSRGRLCPELGIALRRLVVGNYLIFYRIQESQVQVVRVLHGARELMSLFEEE